MGVDFFEVEVKKQKRLKKEQALRQAVAQGEDYEHVHSFFKTLDFEFWEEVILNITIIDPNSPLQMDELFLTRILDEGVASANYNEISYEETPLNLYYNKQLWEWEEDVFNYSDRRFKPQLFVSTLQYHHVNKSKKKILGDSLEVLLFVPSHYVPNLKKAKVYRSRVWSNWNSPYFPRLIYSNQPMKMSVKKLYPSTFLPTDPSLKNTVFTFNKRSKDWSENKIEKHSFYDALSSYYIYCLRYTKRFNYEALRKIFFDENGDKIDFFNFVKQKNKYWFATRNGVLLKKNKKTKLYNKKDGLSENWVDRVCLWGEKLLAMRNGRLSYLNNDTWELFKESLLKNIQQICVDENEQLWARSAREFHVFSDDEYKVFRGLNLGEIASMAPYKGRQVVVQSNKGIFILDSESMQCKKIALFADWNLYKVSSLTVDQDKNIWAISQGNPVLFREDLPPIYFAFDAPLPIGDVDPHILSVKFPSSHLLASLSGDLWLSRYCYGYVKIDRKEVKRAIESKEVKVVKF